MDYEVQSGVNIIYSLQSSIVTASSVYCFGIFSYWLCRFVFCRNEQYTDKLINILAGLHMFPRELPCINLLTRCYTLNNDIANDWMGCIFSNYQNVCSENKYLHI